MSRNLLILASCLLGLPSSLQAETIRVPGDQPTIQGAVAVANSGDTVLVRRGTYREGIYLTERTDLTVRARGKVILDIGHDPIGLLLDRCDQVVVKGFTFRNTTASAVLVRESDDVVLSRCTIEDSTGIGILVATSRGIQLERNRVRHCAGSGLVAHASGLLISRNRIEDVGELGIDLEGGEMLVENNRIVRSGQCGIRLQGDAPLAALLRRNTVIRAGFSDTTDTLGFAIKIDGDGAALVENRIVRCAASGLALDGGRGHLVVDNRISRVRTAGIMALGDDCIIDGNRIVRPGYSGISVGGGGDAILRNNRVTQAGYRGFIVTSSGNLLYRNRSKRSSQVGLFDSQLGVPTIAIDNLFN